MEIIKIVAFSFTALFIFLLFKDKRNDIAVYVSFIAGICIFMYMLTKVGTIITFLSEMAMKANIDTVYLTTVIKIIGIAYISSFCSEICKDAGANSIAAKVEFSGKILILMLAIPILMAVMEAILKIM